MEKKLDKKLEKKREIEDTEELRRVIEELKAKTESINDDEMNEDEMNNAMALVSDNLLEESYFTPVTDVEAGDTEGYDVDGGQLMEDGSIHTFDDSTETSKEVFQEDEAWEEDIEKKAYKNNMASNASNTSAIRKKKRRAKNDGDVIISLEHVTKVYDKGVPALEDVNLKINRGEFVFVVGESGSGKSTLIRLLLRELKPSSGVINVNGFRVDKLRQGKVHKLRRCMGVVFQDFRLLKDRNVYENVAFAQRIIQTPYREMKKNVPNMLSIVGLASKYKAKPSELSGGEQQRVALARALVNKPPILLADEPTGNLDPKTTIEIMNLLDQINKNGTTIIVVTHNDKIVNDMRKRVVTIKNGVIVSDEKKGGYIDED